MHISTFGNESEEMELALRAMRISPPFNISVLIISRKKAKKAILFTQIRIYRFFYLILRHFSKTDNKTRERALYSL